MAIKDIQARLDKAVEQRCEKEFKKAVDQCYKLMKPFYEPMQWPAYHCNKEVIAKQFAEGFKFDSGYIVLFDKMSVPEAYIKQQQDKESDEFIKKVQLLRQDVDQLLESVENIERRG